MNLSGSPAGLLGVGCLLLCLGFGVIFAMTIGVLTPTFLLSFAGYLVSFAGLMLGVIGAVHLHDRRQ